jgi:hypothetical protein
LVTKTPPTFWITLWGNYLQDSGAIDLHTTPSGQQQTSPGDHMPGQDGAAVITVVQPTVPKADTISKNMGKKRPFEKGP